MGKRRGKIVGLLLVVFMVMSCISACGKNEAGVSYGEYKNEEYGTIVLDKDSITFKDMDSDFINERRASEKASLNYFESRNEGVILSSEYINACKENYLSEMADDDYVGCVLSYEYEELEDYSVCFTLYDGEEYITSFYYDPTKNMIIFGDYEFKAD